MDKEKLKDILNRDDIVFVFFAKPRLRELILKGTHPHIVPMNKTYKSDLLSGKGLEIPHKMVYDYIVGAIDEQHKFILNNGQIRVSPVKKKEKK